MRRTIFTLLTLLITLAFLSNTLAQDKEPNGYVGAKLCGMCHKTEKQGSQLSIWENSKHSKAFATLQTDKANKIAKELGHKTPAAETEACLKCHASGYNADASLLGKKFSIEDGVQCETCHGPGSNYKSISIMKNQEKAVANGLLLHDNLEEFCTGCHNHESPTFESFDVDSAWAQIAHPIPGDK